MGPLQFSLRALFVVLAVCAGACTSIHYLGYGPVTLVGAVVLACMGWAQLHYAAPRATTYFTVFAVMGLCLFSLLVAGLLGAREKSRREQSVYIMFQYSQGVQQELSVDPRQAFKYPPDVAAERLAADESEEDGEP